MDYEWKILLSIWISGNFMAKKPDSLINEVSSNPYFLEIWKPLI